MNLMRYLLCLIFLTTIVHSAAAPVVAAKIPSPKVAKIQAPVAKAVDVSSAVPKTVPVQVSQAKAVIPQKIPVASVVKTNDIKQQPLPFACSQIASVVYSQHIQTAPVIQADKDKLLKIWNFLYLGYLVRQSGSELFERSGTSKQVIDQDWQALKGNASTYQTNPFCIYTALKQSSQDIENMHICIDTASLQNYATDVSNCQANLQSMYSACTAYKDLLKMLQVQMSPANFRQVVGNLDSVQSNYVTVHLQSAVARLQATSSIVQNGLSVTTQFAGDIRDMGMIVNIQNNTNYDFTVTQVATPSAQATPIAVLKPGLNNVNLHTAALQAPTATAVTPSQYQWNFASVGSTASGQLPFSVRMMTGTQLLELLRSVSGNKKDIFFMNGRKVAKQYAVNEKDMFLVIVQIPSGAPIDSDGLPVGQRIQAISLAALTGPYLVTLQINEQDIEFTTDADKKVTQKAVVQQPSFVSVQTLQSLDASQKALPLIILPDALREIPALKVYEMLLTTTYIAAATDFKFFDKKCFAEDMQYFKNMGYFDKDKQFRIIVSLHAFYMKKKELWEIPEITESAIFQTGLASCADIPMLYVDQGANGQMVANDVGTEKFNLKMSFLDQDIIKDVPAVNLKFGTVYSIPFYKDWFFVVPIQVVTENLFVSIKRFDNDRFKFVLTDKKDNVVGLYWFYANNKIDTININFLGQSSSWVGDTVPSNYLHFGSKNACDFKITYKYQNQQEQHRLFVSRISPIDKINIKHAVQFSVYPIKEMYLDVYDIYEVSAITRCFVVQNGVLPSFLQSLSQEDWQKGVYMVTEVQNNNALNLHKPGTLTVTFYRADGVTMLGQLHIAGQNQSTHEQGLRGPVHAYNLGGISPVMYYDIYLSTAILLQYVG